MQRTSVPEGCPMGLTYTTAAERDVRRTRQRAERFQPARLSLAVTSGVALLAITLAYLGRISLFDQLERAHAGVPPVNLNVVVDSALLEPALGTVFSNANDRRLAAKELLRFLVEERSQGRALTHVGAIARANVAAATIDRSKNLEAFSQRLQRSRESAAASGRVAPGAMPLLTAAELATLKPLLGVRTRQEFRRELLLYACLYLLAFHLVPLVWWWRGVRGDRLLLAVAHLLTAIGFAALLSRPDPLRDSMLFVRFTEGTLAGLLVMTAVSLVNFGRIGFAELSYLPLAGALSLSALLIAFGSGPGTSNAKVNLGPLQPIEAIRLLLALFLAGYFARRWELLRSLRSKVIRDVRLPEWINLPRAEYALPVLAGVGLSLLFFFLQKDLGPALFLCCVFLAVYAVARGRVEMAVAGFLLLVLGFYIGNRLDISATLAERVRMWQSPWDNTVPGGDQLTRAIWGMATGGWFGTGLGFGDSRYLPAGHTDLILAAIGEELGAAGLTIVAVLDAILAWRGIRIARLARNDYGFFLATALTLFLIVPTLIMASGTLGVTPLTGVVTPFLSYGGSAMAANFGALGMLAAIHADRNPSADFEPFRIPIYWLEGALGVFALALLAVMVDIQIVHADEYAVKPHLGVQADGGRRFQYNPRVLDVVRLLPRGTIYDRQGIPLATEDPKAIAGGRPAYAKLGIALADVCPGSGERCYPLGGKAFHLLGDARTRVNWSAPNTSYVERDAEDRLRGFDDHAVTVRTTDVAGRPMLTLRRDYRELVPALRQRHDPNSTALVRLRSQPRDVRLTIDASLQLRVAAIVASYAGKAAGRAAAVVIDPDTGDLLASASYPWPLSPESVAPVEHASDSLLDRARYGLYPPGSTFKLVTASAALRQHLDPNRTTSMCVRLPDGRVGASIAGWSRPIRDDVLDTHPHGAIDMHEGFVHSCNAYFAQLAVRLGSQPLLDAASGLGISLTPASDAAGRVRATLPQVGYGQGDVVATPLRMARVAAAVASNGVLRDTRWEGTGAADSPGVRFLDADAARLLAGYMRDVVLNGTGRTLRDNPWHIAGKTGTAELTGKPSHSWFVGFAPFGPATRRIAFAVVVENAGYGAGSAAPAAGEIVAAAALAGLVKMN
jgi:cell division protein FtsW (lipid II flippase)